MPNWVTSKLKIEGPNSADIMKSLISFNDAKEVYFDFNKITPMPDELNIVSGSLTDRSIELYLTSINPDVKHIGIENKDYDLFNKQRELANQGKKFGTYADNLSQDEIEEFVRRSVNGDNLNKLKDLLDYGRNAILNVEKFGAMDWYSWSIEHWGTKWNACHNLYDIENSPNEIMFDTAWGNVAELIAKLSTMYPKNEFHFEFAEEWIGNQCGNLTFKNGEKISGDIFEDGSKEAYEQAFRLWGEDLSELYVFDEKKQTYVSKDEHESSNEEEM